MTRGRADLVLLVHLKKGAPLGAVSFDIAMRKVGGRWLVDSAVSAATFAPAGSDSKILAQPDFAVFTPVVVIGVRRPSDRRVRRERSEADRSRVFRNLPDRPN